jgi:hypothetical protein
VVIPDTLGYGESYLFNRMYLINIPSAQAWTVSYLSAQQYIRTVTGACTELSNTTAVGGYGRLGFGNLGYQSFSIVSGCGAIVNLQTQISFWLQELSDNASSPAYTRTSSITVEESLSASDAISSRHYLERMTLSWTFSYSIQQIPVSSNNNPLPSLASLEWRARIWPLSAPDPTFQSCIRRMSISWIWFIPTLSTFLRYVKYTHGRIQSFLEDTKCPVAYKHHLTIVVVVVVVVVLYFAYRMPETEAPSIRVRIVVLPANPQIRVRIVLLLSTVPPSHRLFVSNHGTAWYFRSSVGNGYSNLVLLS